MDMRLYFVLESLNENGYLEDLHQRGWEIWNVEQIHAALASDYEMYKKDLEYLTQYDREYGYFAKDQHVTRSDIADRAADAERCRVYADILRRLLAHTEDTVLTTPAE